MGLYSAPPDGRISAAVKHCEDNQCIRADAEVHSKWKATCNSASNITEYNRVALRCGCSLRDGVIDLADKLLAKARSLFVIPDSCIFKLAFRSTPENNAERHRPTRDRTSALI